MGIESFEAPFITEDRMFVDKHLITSNRAKAMKSGFSHYLPTLGLLSILMLPLAGCDVRTKNRCNTGYYLYPNVGKLGDLVAN